MGHLKSDVNQLKVGQAKLQTDVELLKTGQAKLQGDLAGVKTDLAGVKTEVASLNTRFDSLTTSMNARFDASDARATLHRTEAKADNELLRRDMTIKLGSMMLVAVGVMLAGFRFMPH